MRIPLISGLVVGLAVAAIVVVLAAWPGAGGAAGLTGSNTATPAAGQVTTPALAAYQAAARAMLQCVRDGGVAVSEPAFDSAGGLTYSTPAYATHEEADQARPLVEQCYARYLSEADRAWQLSPEFQNAAELRGWAVMRCIEELNPGFRFSQDQDGVMEQLRGLITDNNQALGTCTDRVAREGTGAIPGAPYIPGAFHPLPR